MDTEINRPEQVIFIRHAESARNKAKKGNTYFADEEARSANAGIPDYRIPLSPEGILQAERTGVYLRDWFGAPDYAYHTGYVRTESSLQGILAAFSPEVRDKIQVRMSPFMRERDPGYTYDMTTEEAERTFPWLYDHWETFGGFFSRPPGGESLSDVSQRVYLGLNALFRDRAGKKVWVVTHGGTLRAIRFILERWTYQQALKWPKGESPANCGITVYNFDRTLGRLVLQEYNTVCPA
jgi:probable phosphoglycerate mutase